MSDDKPETPPVEEPADTEPEAEVVELHPESEAFAEQEDGKAILGAWIPGRNAISTDPVVVRSELMGAIGQAHSTAETDEDKQFVASLYQLIGDESLSLPEFPETPLRLDQLLSEEEPNSVQVMRVIEGDPNLVARVWQRARSARFPTSPSTLDNAVSRIGMAEVWRLSFETAVDSFKVKQGPFRLAADDLRTHGALVGEVTAALAGERRGPKFLAGLFHDIGGLMVLQVASEGTASVATVQDLIDRHHADIAVLIASAWRFDAMVLEGIAYHHDPNAVVAGPKDLARLVHLADIAVDGVLDRRAKRNSQPLESLKRAALRPAMANKAMTLAAHAIKRMEADQPPPE